MLKFFRTIRKKLIEQQNVRKYTLYAIGEILLVVIGILIALQINNWNEKKKNLEAVTNIILELETELINNYEHANLVLGFWSVQDSLSKRVIYDQLTIDDYRKNDLLSIVSTNWFVYMPDMENLNLLLENETYADDRLKPVISTAKRLRNTGNLLDEQWTILRRNLDENLATVVRNIGLVRSDSLSMARSYEYLLTDPDYKRSVELNWVKIQNYYDYISRYRAQTIALLSTIKVVQEDYDPEELETLYAEIGMKPFKAYDCVQDFFERNNELRSGYIIGNVSSEVVHLSIINDGKVSGSYTLLPYQFRHTRSEYAGLDGDYTVIAVQTDEQGNCIDRFIAVNKGYLIIN